MSSRLSYVVFGAGNGGCAMAAELALLGRQVALVDYSEFADRLAPIRDAGGITVESRIDHFPGGRGIHFARLPRVTTDASVIAGADVLIIVVPGQHHDKVIRTALPYLRRGQLVLLNPGGVGGALVWGKALAQAGVRGVLLAQPSDLLYAGSRSPSAKVLVNGKKKKARLGFIRTGTTLPYSRFWRMFSPSSRPRTTRLSPGSAVPACWCIRCPC